MNGIRFSAFIPILILCSCASRDYSLREAVPVEPAAYQSTYSQAPLVTVSPATPFVWPLTLSVGSTNITVYQPQIDSWDSYHLTGRSAVAIQAIGQENPIYGVIGIQAGSLVDKNSRSVSIEQAKVTSADFPSAPAQQDDYLRIIREKFPKEIPGLSLNAFQASLTNPAATNSETAQPLNNTPPKVVISTKPAILVSIDGAPAYRPVPGTELQRVINTRVLLFKDPSGRHFLHVFDGYMEAPSLEGPWTVAKQVPPGAAVVEMAANASTPVDLLQEKASAKPPSVAVIFVATQPTELLTFDGPPQFVPIEGTDLLYAANTSGNVFKNIADQNTFVLLSGRWYRARSLDGPWQFVPGSQLPPGFAKIPDGSAKANVKANVPGTRQATEALIANRIPQSNKVPRSTAMQAPQIEGPPQLRSIEGTRLFFVANSGTPVIKVDDHSWYACQNGVWFSASSVGGPWTIAASVPQEIYTIPVTSPLHYLTYVRIYGADAENVYVGFTPGYYGTEVSPEGTVVYGTGYPYDPWIGDTWYGGPTTWGYGWGPCWDPWDDWCYGLGFGWGFGIGSFHHWRCNPPRPCWGPFRHWHHSDRAFVGVERDGRFVNTPNRVYARPGFAETRAANGRKYGPSENAYSFGRSPGSDFHDDHRSRGYGNSYSRDPASALERHGGWSSAGDEFGFSHSRPSLNFPHSYGASGGYSHAGSSHGTGGGFSHSGGFHGGGPTSGSGGHATGSSSGGGSHGGGSSGGGHSGGGHR